MFAIPPRYRLPHWKRDHGGVLDKIGSYPWEEPQLTRPLPFIFPASFRELGPPDLCHVVKTLGKAGSKDVSPPTPPSLPSPRSD